MISSVIFAGPGRLVGGGFFPGFFFGFFPLALSAPCSKFCLHFAKAFGRLRVFRRGRRLRLRVLEHREGDAQCAGSYGEHTVLPAQIRTEGAQKQQHHKRQQHQKQDADGFQHKQQHCAQRGEECSHALPLTFRR